MIRLKNYFFLDFLVFFFGVMASLMSFLTLDALLFLLALLPPLRLFLVFFFAIFSS